MSVNTFDLVRWLHGASPRADAPDVFASARLSVIDFVGCAISAADSPSARAVSENLGVPGEVPVLGQTTTRLHPASAAYLHALQAHALEMDDGDWDSWGHLGAPTIAAALSAGWRSDATMADVVDAVATAFVFGMALGRQVNPTHYDQGFCTTGTIGTLTAATAAARVLGLDEVSTAHALDFAVAQAAGVRQFALDGSASCMIIPANAARAGYEAAALAAAGLAGGLEALDGELGFLRVVGGKAPELFMPEYTEHRLSQIYYKPHSCCGNALGPIQGFVEAWQRLGHTPLHHIRFELPSQVARNVDHASPGTELERHLSLQLAVAMYLSRGGIEARDLIDLAMTAELEQFMGMVHIAVLKSDDAAELGASEMGFVTLAATDGRGLRVPVAVSGPAMGGAEIDAKFRSLVRPSLGEQRTERLRSMLCESPIRVREALLAGQRHPG